MTGVTLQWRNYRYFPYEKEFARRETEQLFGVSARADESGIHIPTFSFHALKAARLTYIARAVPPSGDVVIPQQVMLEATASVGPTNRQATRYSAHGLHEYKGRFNPQVVRAIGNMLGLRANDRVLDPFCGSGTTLLECAHAGWNATGIDLNPLAIQISNAKIHAIRSASRVAALADLVIEQLQAYSRLSSSCDLKSGTIVSSLGTNWQRDLPAFSYLERWFPLPVLAQVVAIRRVLMDVVRAPADRRIFEVILSDQLRDVSLQDPRDLRIRLRRDAEPNYPLIDLFVRSLPDRLGKIVRAKAALGTINTAQRAFLQDNRTSLRTNGLKAGAFDAVITSPPYEAALPYIDTQRLSLVLFGHIGAGEIQRTEQALTGAREIGPVERRELEAQIVAGDPGLPADVVELCRELLAAASGPGNGFRKQNRPALVYRYFKGMASFFSSVRGLVKPGGKVALVVGPTKTTLSGREYVIDTPRHLIAIGVHCGLAESFALKMDTYQRYDLHQRNSIASEMLTVLEAPPRNSVPRGRSSVGQPARSPAH